jgi:3',5'-cyclic AMP phosphodiesterase CpdA
VEPTIEPTETPIVGKSFAVMADIHNDTTSLQKALKQAKSRGDILVVVAGDVSIDGTAVEVAAVRKVLDESGMEYVAVPGNHDRLSAGAKGRNVWQDVFGSSYGVKSFAGTKIILIDNSSWKGLGSDQKAWLPTAVADCKIVTCIAVMHMPLDNPISAHVMGEYTKSTSGEALWLRDLLVSNGVKDLMAGHIHMSTNYEFGGLRTTLVGAINKDRNTETSRWTEVSPMTGLGLIQTKVVEVGQ